MSLEQAVNNLKEFNKDPEGKVAEIAKLLDQLLDGSPSLEEIESSKIKLNLKLVIKKTKNSVVKEKAESLISKYQNAGQSSGKASQTPSRSTSKDLSKETRHNIRDIFRKTLLASTTDEKKATEISTLIEDALAQDFMGDDYNKRATELIMVLKKKGETLHLTKNLISGALNPHDFVKMTNDDFLTPEEKKKQEEIAKKAMDSTCTPQFKKVASRIFRCPKCGSMETFFSQLQTRGGDEPMTNFCECLKCGFTFKR